MKENPKYILLIQKKSRKTKKGTKTDKIESKRTAIVASNQKGKEWEAQRSSWSEPIL